MYVHAEKPGAHSQSPDEPDAQTRDTWEHEYSPAAGDTVVDIGAGTGTEILRWSWSVGADGRVVGVEAHPWTFGVMKALCALNRLTNVELLNIAVADDSGTIGIEALAEHEAASIVTGQGAVPVQWVTVDELPALRVMHAGVERISGMCVVPRLPRGVGAWRGVPHA